LFERFEITSIHQTILGKNLFLGSCYIIKKVMIKTWFWCDNIMELVFHCYIIKYYSYCKLIMHNLDYFYYNWIIYDLVSFSLFELLFKVMHNIVLWTIQVAMRNSIYISISCDKVTTIVYVYVIEEWKKIQFCSICKKKWMEPPSTTWCPWLWEPCWNYGDLIEMDVANKYVFDCVEPCWLTRI